MSENRPSNPSVDESEARPPSSRPRHFKQIPVTHRSDDRFDDLVVLLTYGPDVIESTTELIIRGRLVLRLTGLNTTE